MISQKKKIVNLQRTKILNHKFDLKNKKISNYTSDILEAKQPTQATTIENLKYETSCQNNSLLIVSTGCNLLCL